MRGNIYPQQHPYEGGSRKKGEHMPSIWLHGKAEDLAGYDLVNGDYRAFHCALRQGGALVDIHYADEKRTGVMVTHFDGWRGMEGYICLLDDLDALMWVMKETSMADRLTMYDNDFKWLLDKHVEAYKILRGR